MYLTCLYYLFTCIKRYWWKIRRVYLQICILGLYIFLNKLLYSFKTKQDVQKYKRAPACVMPDYFLFLWGDQIWRVAETTDRRTQQPFAILSVNQHCFAHGDLSCSFWTFTLRDRVAFHVAFLLRLHPSELFFAHAWRFYLSRHKKEVAFTWHFFKRSLWLRPTTLH